jgi:hypothetical protein
MALMKTGRKPYGEDPKKPNGVEPNKKQYTWDDVSKSEEIKSRNKAAKQQYESDVANYNKAMKLYKEGPESINDTTGGIKTSGKLKEGGVAKFESIRKEDSVSAEKMNRDIDSKIKKGEIVPIDDPSLDPTTRRLIAGANVGTKEGRSDIFGTTGKRYVPKGTKYTSYKEIYGEDYNPEEYQAASKAGKLSEYNEKKGYEGRTFKPVNLTQYESYKTPEQAKVPAYEKEMSIDVNRVPLPKMEKKKSDVKPLRISESKPTTTEKPDWEAPDGSTKYRTKYILPDISTTNKGKSLGRFIKAKAEAIGKDNALTPGLIKTQGKERLIQGKTGREAKMAKAYFGGGYEGQSKFDIEGTSEERGRIGALKADKADFSKGIKEARKAGDREKVQGYRAAKKDVKSEIKQAKLASKYLTKLGQEFTGVREGQELRSTGKIKANTPAAYLGFTGSKQDTYNSDANFNKFLAKSSTDNPANRNTIPKQMETVEPKMTRSQRKEDRKTQEKVMKNMKN